MRAERGGDAASYELFLKDLARSLRTIVRLQFRRLRLDQADVEDAVQEILIAVHTRRGQWDETRPLLPWLNAITRYKLIDAMRRSRRDTSARASITEAEWSAAFSWSDRSTEGTSAEIERGISELPPGQRSVVRAVGIEGDSPQEAAVRLGMSEGAVRVAFHRSLKRLVSLAESRA